MVGGHEVKVRQVNMVVCFSPATFSHLSAGAKRLKMNLINVFCHISKMEREGQGN